MPSKPVPWSRDRAVIRIPGRATSRDSSPPPGTCAPPESGGPLQRGDAFRAKGGGDLLFPGREGQPMSGQPKPPYQAPTASPEIPDRPVRYCQASTLADDKPCWTL